MSLLQPDHDEWIDGNDRPMIKFFKRGSRCLVLLPKNDYSKAL